MDDLKFSDIIKQNNIWGNNLSHLPKYNISLLSNVTVNQFKPVLEYYLRKNNINAELEIGNYDNVVQDAFLCKGQDAVIVDYSLLGFIDKCHIFIEDMTDDGIVSFIGDIKSEIKQVISSLNDAPLLIFNTFSSIGVYSNAIKQSKCQKIVSELNDFLTSISLSNFHLMNISTLISKIGELSAFDSKMYTLSKSVYSFSFIKEYSYEVSPFFFKYSGKLKKAIIFDCDNTLWKGILSEDGEDNIDMSSESKIGNIYNKVQQIAVWLAHQGVIVCLCSKNNRDDVIHVLKFSQDMVLKEDIITAYRINWQDKATNIIELSKELNIGTDSFVFVDDSDFEINLINDKLPEVFTLQVPSKLETYPSMLLDTVNRFFYLSGSKDDIDKNIQYKQQHIRDEESKKFDSIDDYIKSLNIQVVAHINDVSKIERISQLTQKTNQFNLTTKRYTESQIECMMKDSNWKIYSFDISDKFGDSGLTAICIVNIENKDAIIDSFLMSCRIMGRNIEYVLMKYIINDLSNCVTKFNASFLPTIKNKPVYGFFDNVGFSVIEKRDDETKYELSVNDMEKIKNINYININYGIG